MPTLPQSRVKGRPTCKGGPCARARGVRERPSSALAGDEKAWSSQLCRAARARAREDTRGPSRSGHTSLLYALAN